MVARAVGPGVPLASGYRPEPTTRVARHWVSAVGTSWVVPALALVLVATLALVNLAYFPRTWFDEGLNLLAAKSLALTGRYGLETADGFSPFDLGLSTGPTVIVPIGMLFKLLGVGLFQARLVPAAYIVVAAAGLYWTGRQLFDRGVALVAVVAFASLTVGGPFTNGRNVLGDIAGVAYLVWGAGVLARARGSTHSGALHALAGLLFGLAILTKNQLVLIAPVVAALWLAGWLRATTRLPLRNFVWLMLLIAMPTIGWYAYQYAAMGASGFIAHLLELRGEASASLVVAPLRKTPAALNTLLNAGFATWGLAGLIYVGMLAAQRRWWRAPERLVLPVFALAWLVFFVGFSIGWDRYAVPAVITTSLFVGKLVCDLARRVTTRTGWLGDPLAIGVLVLLVGGLGSGIVQNGSTIARAHDSSP